MSKQKEGNEMADTLRYYLNNLHAHVYSFLKEYMKPLSFSISFAVFLRVESAYKITKPYINVPPVNHSGTTISGHQKRQLLANWMHVTESSVSGYGYFRRKAIYLQAQCMSKNAAE